MYIYSLILSATGTILGLYCLKSFLNFGTGILMFLSLFLGCIATTSLCELFRQNYRNKIPENNFIIYFIDYGIYACSIIFPLAFTVAIGAATSMINLIMNANSVLILWTLINIIFAFTFTTIAYPNESTQLFSKVKEIFNETLNKVKNSNEKENIKCPKCDHLNENTHHFCQNCGDKLTALK